MSVWLTIPSSRPPATANPVLQKWRDMGYKIALWCDRNGPGGKAGVAHVLRFGEYPGYAEAVNILIAEQIAREPAAEWFVIGGDDTLPDPDHTADEIAAQCARRFSMQAPATTLGVASMPVKKCALEGCGCKYLDTESCKTFGLMQPTGDRYAGGQIDRICGSAWIGREFAKRVNQGCGPLWPEYTHMFVDQELQEVAQRLGVLWQRPDLTQLHMQYCRESAALDAGVVQAPVPEHILHDGYTPEHWLKYETLFLKRKAEGFLGSELL